jgi:hypothetical protein
MGLDGLHQIEMRAGFGHRVVSLWWVQAAPGRSQSTQFLT